MNDSGKDPMAWLNWDDASFELAKQQDKPVLLTIVASWCRHCKELDNTTFRDPRVLKEIAANYIPIRVDKDRRPEINARYNCGGWPTVAFLTPDRELIAGETFLTASELIPILERVAPFFREHRGEIQNRVEEMEEIRIRQQDRREVGPLGPDMINFVSHSILESFDAVHGGFGTGPKFPHAEAIDFALAEYVRHGDERLRNVVVRTLDAMVDGEIYDPVEGGFFRFSQGRDWHTPNTEKVLDSNAARVRFYLEAYQVFKKDSYKKQAAGTLNWLESRMLDSETGAFFGSQDAAPEYYGLPIELRRTRPAPRIERTLYADWNAMAASSLFLASVVFNEAKYSQMACRTLSFIMDEMFDERRGVYHYWDDTFRLPGLLSDQVYTLRALLDAASHTGDPRMLSRAARLAQVIRLRHLSPTGAFYDLSHDAAELKKPVRRNRSILENSILAESFIQLSILLREPEYLQTAQAALEAFTQDFRQYGYYAAGFARALDLIFHPPLLVTIVGDSLSPKFEELRSAALTNYIPNRVVDSIDPARFAESKDELTRKRSGEFPRRNEAVAFVAVGQSSYAEVIDPADLPSVLEMAERDRMR